jgi:hypothetical protein
MDAELKWEKIPSDEGEYKRAAIHGGWLVETSSYSTDGWHIALTFVPDPGHVWGAVLVGATP